MSKKKIITAAAVSLGMLESAFADSTNCFNGLFVTGVLGGAVQDTKLIPNYNVNTSSGYRLHLSNSGISEGVDVSLGYAFSGTYYVAAIAKTNWSDISSSILDGNPVQSTNSISVNLKRGFSWGVGGKIGYVMGGKFLPYVGVAYINTKWKSQANVLLNGTNRSNSKSKDLDGVGIFVGSEYCLNKALTVGAYAQYNQYSKFNYTLPNANGTTFAKLSFKPKDYSAFVTVSYKLDSLWGGIFK